MIAQRPESRELVTCDQGRSRAGKNHARRNDDAVGLWAGCHAPDVGDTLSVESKASEAPQMCEERYWRSET